MKLFKIWMVLAIAAAMILSPVWDSLAQAGSITYNGISSIAVEDDNEIQRHRGLMLNFSFGGPKDYKQKNSLQEDVLKRDEKINKIGGYVLLVVAVGTFIVIEANDD
jgi:hypothetical protein